MTSEGHLLVGDIGGTTTRLAVTSADRHALERVRVYHSKDYPTLEQVLRAYLVEAGAPRLVGACLAPAGPVVDGVVKVTNIHWPACNIASLCQALGTERVLLINDFAAVAYAIPHLPAAELVRLGGGAAKAGSPILVLGPGTGLGMAYIVPLPDGRQMVNPGEAGVGSPPLQTERELAIARHVRGSDERIITEHLVSGSGIIGMYKAIGAIDHKPAPLTEAAQVGAAAVAGTDAVAVEALDLFLTLLGRVAGDLALALLSEGGVYLAGGILPKVLLRVISGPLRQEFDHKPLLQRIVEAMPVTVITTTMPALTGAAAAFAEAHPGIIRM